MGKRRANNEGSIFKEKSSGLWVAEVSVEGKKKRKRSKSQATVKAWLLTQRNAIKDGVWVANEATTLSEFIDRYWTDVALHTLRPATLDAYESLIRIHIKPALGNVRLTALKPEQLQSFYSTKINSGLSKRTVQFCHNILHKCLDQAWKWGLVGRNVADLVDPPSPKRKAPTTWGVDDVRKFLAAVEGHRFYSIYTLAVYTGMREGELLGIHFEDVDLLHKVINVKHQVQTINHQGLVINEPKSDKSKRQIVLPGAALSVLMEYLYNKKENQGLIFTTSTGHPISPRNVVRHFKEVIAEQNLPMIRFHDLRHTHASLLLLAGVNPKVVQERLGHSQISLTLDTYSHLLPGLQEEAAEKFDAIFASELP
jgi:integrase